MKHTLFSAVLAGLASVTRALPTISAVGTKFYDSNGDQFFLKGIAYQLSPMDPLADEEQCRLDATLMQELGANSIRVYHVEPYFDHRGCMQVFDDAGIYLWVDLDTFSTQIEQESPHWNQTQKEAFEAVMDEFQQYDNTAGFFVGNEVLTQSNHSEAAVFVKAATRDMKAYRDKMGYRKIPIGYSHADISDLRPNLQNYLACGDNPGESIDFFGLNAYEWCGDVDYDTSGYDNLTSQIKQNNIPFFLSEDGCNTSPPRTFEDQDAVFGKNMAPYWSGAIIYEWLMEANHYGLVAYDRDDANALTTATIGESFSRMGTPTPVSPDFSNLMSVWATNTPVSTPMNEYTPQASPPPCPAYTADLWLVAGDVALPSLGQDYNADVQFSITAGHARGQPSAAESTGAAVRSMPPSWDKEFIAIFATIAGFTFGFTLLL